MVCVNTKAEMKGSSDSTTSTKCLSGFLRSLLCTGSLPTHPSDQFIESSKKQIDERKIEKSFEFETDVKRATPNSNTPGVVARLMGLDSFPDTPLSQQKQRTLGSYFRSRSANSIDFFSQFDPIKPASCLHRRVRTCVSFREVPSLLHDKFSVVFPLEEVYETAEYGEEFLTMKRPKNSCRKGKREKWATSRNAENLEEKKVRQKSGKKLETKESKRSVCVKLNSGVTSQKKDFHGKTSLKLKEQRAVPLQVLNKPVDSKEKRPIIKPAVKKKIHSAVKKIQIHSESPVKEASSRAMYSNKHASTSKSQRACSNGPHRNNNGENRGAIVKGKVERKLKKEGSFQYKNMVEEIMIGLTQEISGNEICCDWMYGQILNFKDFEDICLQIGQQILEVLLYQIVDELLLIYATRN